METKIKSPKKYDADTMACIQSAYEDLQLMIEEIFTDLLKISDQLSLIEFIFLFEKYDWIDIVASIEEICPLADNNYCKSLKDLLLVQLAKSNTPQIANVLRNSYFREYEYPTDENRKPQRED